MLFRGGGIRCTNPTEEEKKFLRKYLIVLVAIILGVVLPLSIFLSGVLWRFLEGFF